MKAKSIENHLNKVFNEWLETLKSDPDVYRLVKRDTIITGGCIASMLLNEKINDYDVYFTTKQTALLVGQYYAYKNGLECQQYPNSVEFKLPKGNVKIESLSSYHPIYFSSNAVTLNGNMNDPDNNTPNLQVMIRFFGDIDTIHSTFDYVHPTNYWIAGENKLVLRKKALESLLSKTLYYQGSKYPICSVIRSRKFIKRGWSITAGEYLKMCFQISQLDLSDSKVLTDQLIGVDSAYFGMFLDLLRKEAIKITKEGAAPLNMTTIRINELIDEISN